MVRSNSLFYIFTIFLTVFSVESFSNDLVKVSPDCYLSGITPFPKIEEIEGLLRWIEIRPIDKNGEVKLIETDCSLPDWDNMALYNKKSEDPYINSLQEDNETILINLDYLISGPFPQCMSNEIFINLLVDRIKELSKIRKIIFIGDSDGGRSSIAEIVLNLMDELETSGALVYVPQDKHCDSACALIFLYSKNRGCGSNSQIGIHSEHLVNEPMENSKQVESLLKDSSSAPKKWIQEQASLGIFKRVKMTSYSCKGDNGGITLSPSSDIGTEVSF